MSTKLLQCMLIMKIKKLNDKTSSSFGQRGATLINESGLYSLILSSKMPRAKGFKRWVTANILPTLRRTGGYVANEDMFIENYLPLFGRAVSEFVSPADDGDRQAK